MVAPINSFDGLRQFDEALARYGATAERLVTDLDPGPCLNSLRKFGERLAKLLAVANGISTSIDDGSRTKNRAVAELLDELKLHLPRDTVEEFYTVNKLGNKGSHDDEETVTHEDARKALESARKLALWFLRESNGRRTGDEAEHVDRGNGRQTTIVHKPHTDASAQNLFLRRVGFAGVALAGIAAWYLWYNSPANVEALTQ